MPAFDPPLSPREAADVVGQVRGLEFVKFLTQGGQGATALVRIEQALAVLKVYGPNAEVRARREIELLRSLNHPSLAALMQSGVVVVRGSECPYAITEYVAGSDLRARLRSRGPLSEQETVVFLTDMATVLSVLWERRIVHRDIKPDNVILREDHRFVLIDLGVARSPDFTTVTAGWVGTQGYMAPEQALGERLVTVKADIFSLGVSGYEMLSGRHPFGHAQDRIMNLQAPTYRLNRDGIASSRLADVIEQMMAWRAIDRPSPAQVLQRLASNR